MRRAVADGAARRPSWRRRSCATERYAYWQSALEITLRSRCKSRWPRSLAGWRSSSDPRTSGRDEAASRPWVRPAHTPTGLAAPHGVRHTCGTLFIAHPTAQIEQLKKLMGRADISTTAMYLHQSESDLEVDVRGHGFVSATFAADAQRRPRARTRVRSGL